jgi:hypothetical protein
MSDEFDYQNPQQGTSGRRLRRQFGDPGTGQGSFDLDVVGRGAGGFGDAGASQVVTFPSSSRCAATRYHYGGSKLLMTWTNGKTPWIYHDVPVTIYQTFVSSPSKGRFVNSTLNNFAHNKIYPGEEYAEFVYGAMPSA